MKESIKTVFQCEHCKRNMLVKNACIKHEENCTKNPKNWPKCGEGCLHLEEYKKTIYYDNPYNGYVEKECVAFRCTKLNIGVYPKKAEKYALLYPEDFEGEKLMPVECDDYKFHF